MNRDVRDDFQGDRLFLKKMNELGLEVIDFGFFRENVIWIKTKQGKYVLKGFNRSETCNKQLKLSKLYHGQKPRIMGTYTVFPNQKKTVQFGKYIWAIMPFYKGEGLHFGKKDDVKAGIDAISRFHSFSKHIPDPLYEQLTSYSLFKKWSDRLDAFKFHARSANWNHQMRPLISEIIMWGEWSLNHFDHEAVEKLEKKAYKKKEITHGDVAPHNFVKHKEKDTYLIDFDLFAAVPQAFDWLQYANRILPFWHWSYETMEEVGNEDFLKGFTKRWFVISLVFPTDLYREWNRALKTGDKEMIDAVTRFTLRDFSHRKKFVEKIMKRMS